MAVGRVLARDIWMTFGRVRFLFYTIHVGTTRLFSFIVGGL
jgi:hypothetical protein